MKSYIIVILSIFILTVFFSRQSVYAQSLEEFKEERRKEMKEFKEAYTREYEEYARKEKEGVEKLRQELKAYWGESEAKVSSNKEWVDYSEDRQTRTDVNFENGIAVVEILLTPEEAKNTELVKNSLRTAVKDMVFNTCTTYDGDGNDPDEGMLDGQLQTVSGKPVSTRNAEIFADEQTSADAITYKAVLGTDGQSRIKVEVKMPLVPDHILVRAKKFKPSIDEYSERFDMPERLIYAIIETESTFNPKARSYVPAYGLMQIVPRYAGRDAYNFLFKKDTIITADYLYRPKNNIELGTAYFKLLMTHYFKGIKNQDNRMLCSIAAYNTGTGNVYKAFTETSGKSNIIKKINAMSYDELFSFLQDNLPHNETRNYIVKVTGKMEQYEVWLKE